MSDRMKMPPEQDFRFYQRRKHDKWREVPPPEPALEAPVADSHAHLHMLPDPAWELARCAANGVDWLCEIVDPAEDGSRPLDELDSWKLTAQQHLEQAGLGLPCPETRAAVGVHPHNARLFDEDNEALLLRLLEDPRVGAVGEIGLDYHYDLSPHDVQRRVFRRQVEIAKQLGLPIVLHLRGEQDGEPSEAHREALELLGEDGFPEAGTLLHCCALPPDELSPWIEAGCFIAYGGTLTFKNAQAARDGALLVPAGRLMLETDSPYMAPEPMRGATCTPAHVVFTAARLAELHGLEPGENRRAFLQQLHGNTEGFYAGGA